jgi:hypothetical protein
LCSRLTPSDIQPSWRPASLAIAAVEREFGSGANNSKVVGMHFSRQPSEVCSGRVEGAFSRTDRMPGIVPLPRASIGRRMEVGIFAAYPRWIAASEAKARCVSLKLKVRIEARVVLVIRAPKMLIPDMVVR